MPTLPPWTLLLDGRPRLQGPEGRQQALEGLDAWLLAWLALEGPTPRTRWMALLWPDQAPDATLRNRLRQRLFALKRRAGVEVVSGGETLALGADVHWPGLDVAADTGSLLEMPPAGASPELLEWRAGWRQRQQAMRRDRLAAQSARLEHEGRLAEALLAAEALVAAEPLLEHGHRQLMSLHHLRGDRAAAVAAFERCERTLKDELGVRPSPETLALLAQVESAAAPAAPAARRVPLTLLRPPRLVGRDAEWRALGDAWHEGRPALLLGDAGMGKSRLLADLAASQPAAAHAQAGARPGDAGVPYGLACRLLRAWLALAGEPEPGVRRELARLLPELGDPPTEGEPARLQAAVETLLQQAVQAGLQAVLVDDLHFADEASVQLLHRLSGHAPRWVFALREAEGGAAAAALAADVAGPLQGRRIALAPLNEAAIAELVDSLQIEGLQGSALAAELRQRTGGNPLFVLETLKDRWVAPRSDLAPAKVTALIDRRIGQLSREAVRLARCAAVAGGDFSAALAARVLGMPALDLADAWSELEAAQVFRDAQFAHDLIRDAALGSVPPPIAQELHRQIAQWLQDAAADPARAAAHWLAGGEEARAVPLLEAAVQAALRALRYPEALDMLERLQSILGRLGRTGERLALINRSIATAVLAGSADFALRLSDQALAAARDGPERGVALVARCDMLSHRGQFAEAEACAREALPLLRNDGEHAHAARLVLANLLSHSGRSLEAEALLGESEAWLDSPQGARTERIAFEAARAFAIQGGDQPARAVDAWRRVLDLARTQGHGQVLPSALANQGAVLFACGRLEEAREAFAQSLQLVGGDGADHQMAKVLGLRLATIDRHLGRYGHAVTTLEALLAKDLAPSQRDEARLTLVLALADMGQTARALHLAKAEPVADDGPFAHAWYEGLAGLDGATAASWEARALASAERLLAGPTERRHRFAAWRLVVRFHADTERALALGREAMDYARQGGMSGQWVTLAACTAARLAAVGRQAEAHRLAGPAWQLSRSTLPTWMAPGRVWLALHDVLTVTDEALARELLAHAAAWIYRCAADHVPATFRESFLHREKAHAELLRRAKR